MELGMCFHSETQSFPYVCALWSQLLLKSDTFPQLLDYITQIPSPCDGEGGANATFLKFRD